jgi:hypothetical protein
MNGAASYVFELKLITYSPALEFEKDMGETDP